MNVLLIDDHPMNNRGVASFLESGGRFSVCTQIRSLGDAKRFIEEAETLPDLVLLDIILGDENGLDFLPFLENHCRAKKQPKPHVLVCSAVEEPMRIHSAIKQGASGYISKADGESELLAAIDAILRGETYLSDRHSAKTLQALGLYEKLSKREIAVLSLVKEGMGNSEIAEKLCVNIRTVESHVSNIYFKTRTASRHDLMKL